MFCVHCGKEMIEADRFCRQCGFAAPGQATGFAPTAGPVKRLRRSNRDRKLGGVCAGVAEYLEIDIVLIRLLVVAATIFSGGICVLAYIAAWIIMPLGDRVILTPPPMPSVRTAQTQ